MDELLLVIIVLPICWGLLWIGKYLSPPHPKRFRISWYKPYAPIIYVENKIECNISKRPSIDREEVENVLNAIQREIQSHDRDGIKHCSISSVTDLTEIVRKYNFEVDREMLLKVADCVKFADLYSVSYLLEAYAIMQHCYEKHKQGCTSQKR